MPKVLALYRVFDDPFNYSFGVFYTILPSNMQNNIPEQKVFCSSGINKNIYFESSQEAKKAMITDIKDNIFGDTIFSDITYYVIIELETDLDDLFYADSDAPEYGVEDMYIIKNNEFIKLTCDQYLYQRYKNITEKI